MEGSALQDVAMATAAGLGAVTRSYPFGPEHDVFKVAGKVFLMATELRGVPIVTMKCEPPPRSTAQTVTEWPPR